MIGYCGHSCDLCAAVTEGEYDLCARQFESIPNLVKTGKLPARVGGG